MASLQIRELPEHVYRMLADKAQRERRSLAQQAIVELDKLTEAEGRSRRLRTVAALQAAIKEGRSVVTRLEPADAIREDRDR
ncbi:MAG: hypothetical protein CO108_07270 [Deltaproteobacteria bacterium CG_4_9_14_3_um_filter_63_12]|nr:MAG: hypothetical protein CO108_07270 [Deltaproteobacteria bacterium CG_4_9_14_3_um_filter_63_12]